MAKFEFNKIFDFDTFNSNLEASHTNLTKLNADLQEIAKYENVALFGGVKELKNNNLEIQKTIKLLESKQKIDKLLKQNEEFRNKLVEQNTKKTKENNAVVESKIKQQQILNNVINQQLTKEQRLSSQLDILKEKRKQVAKELGVNSKKYFELTAKINDYTEKLKRERREQQLNDKINRAALGSLEQLRAKKALLEIQTAKLSEEERENTEVGRKMVAELAAVNEELIKFGKNVNDGRPNVGRYTESILAAAGSLGELGGEFSNPFFSIFGNIIGKTTEKFKELNEAQDDTNKNTKKVKAGFKGFAALGIAGILASVATYFTQTAAGAQTLEIKMTQLKLALKPIIGFIGSLGGLLVNKLQKGLAVASLKFLQFTTGIKNGINSVVGVFGKKVFDTSEAQAEIDKLNKEIDTLNKEADDTSVSFTDLKDSIAEAWKEGEKLALLEISIRKQKRAIELSNAELQKQYELYQAIGEDDSKNFDRRKAAQLKAIELNEKIATQRLDLAKKEIEAAQINATIQEKAGLKSDEVNDRLKDAKIGLIEAEKEYMLQVRDNAEMRNKLISDAAELDIDINRDAFDSKKTVNEQLIASDKLTFEARQKLLDETVKEGEASFNREIELIENYRKASIKNDNEMINAQLALFNTKKSLTKEEIQFRAELQSQLQENNSELNNSIDIQKMLNAGSMGELELMIKNAKLAEKFGIQILTSIRDRWAANQDLKASQEGLDDAIIASAENQFKVSNAVLEVIRGQKNSLGELIITDNEYYNQKIENEKTLLNAQLARITAIKSADITAGDEAEMLRIKKRLSELTIEQKKYSETVKESKTPVQSLFKLLSGGLKEGSEDYKKWEGQFEKALTTISSSIFEAYNTIQEGRLKDLRSELEVIQASKDAKQEQIDEEQAKNEEGLANNLELRQEQMEELKKQEAEKQKQIEKTEKRQKIAAMALQVANTAVTVSELIKAASAAFAAHAGIPFVGVALGAAAAAAILASFISISAQMKGFHDGTEYVDAPVGRDKGIARIEKGERILTASQNADIPSGVRNKDVPRLIRFALTRMDTGAIESRAITFNSEKTDMSKVENNLEKLYQQNLNRDEVISTKDGYLIVSYKNGKISRMNKKL